MTSKCKHKKNLLNNNIIIKNKKIINNNHIMKFYENLCKLLKLYVGSVFIIVISLNDLT